MKSLLAIAILSLGLCGCMGPDGNPDAMPYATGPGGTMASPPSPPAGEITYDPNTAQSSFDDMRVGGGGMAPAPLPHSR